MKQIICASLAIISLGLLGVNFAGAIELNDDQKATVSQTCVNAQSNLQRVNSSDTTTRINRGRNYDQILKLFYLMNTRAASNNIAEPKLAETTNRFEAELANFRENYNLYNAQLKSTVDFGCSSAPQEFYNQLDRTREKRIVLNENVTRLNSLIEEYKAIIRELTL